MVSENEIPFIPLDTSQWTEPTRRFLGKLTMCRYGTTDDAKGKDGRTFTETRGLPRPTRTFRVEVERLDAIYDLPTGDHAPVMAYLTLDLEKKLKDGRIVPLSIGGKGDNKPTFTLIKWATAGVSLAPDPSVNEGLIAEWEELPSKLFGGMAAKGILYPVKLLPKDYKFDGEVQHFEVKREQTADLDQMAAEATAVDSAAATFDDDELAAMLVGTTDETETTGPFVKAHGELPADIKLGIVTGDVQTRLVADGKLVKGKDGKYALPE